MWRSIYRGAYVPETPMAKSAARNIRNVNVEE